jgi:hypothetical protein
MMKTERELIESARDKFRRAEVLIASGIKDVGNVVAINQVAGNAVLMNAASMAEAKMIVAFGGLKLAHAEGTDILLANWPDFGAEVTTRGPGR